jgi:hypothetical protein
VCVIALIFGLAFGLTHKPDHKDHDSKTHLTVGRPFRPKYVHHPRRDSDISRRYGYANKY